MRLHTDEVCQRPGQHLTLIGRLHLIFWPPGPFGRYERSLLYAQGRRR